MGKFTKVIRKMLYLIYLYSMRNTNGSITTYIRNWHVPVSKVLAWKVVHLPCNWRDFLKAIYAILQAIKETSAALVTLRGHGLLAYEELSA